MAKLGDIEYLVVHCSGTPPETDIDAIYLDTIHRGYGWRKIGFHLVIKRDGTIQRGRPETEAGQHLKGYDDRSLSICLIGGLHESETYTRRGTSFRKPWPDYEEEQLESLRAMLNAWKVKYPKAVVLGHSDINRGRCCPCFDVPTWYSSGNLLPDISTPLPTGYIVGDPIT